MELVYLWVEEYKNIKNQGFNFSPRFTCKYENGELTIEEKKDYVSIFSPNINVTAIVGENGSGKSSILECLNDIIDTETLKHKDVIAGDEHYINFILVLRIEKTNFIIKNFDNIYETMLDQDINTILSKYHFALINRQNEMFINSTEIAKKIIYTYLNQQELQLTSFMYLPNQISIKRRDFDIVFSEKLDDMKIERDGKYEPDLVYLERQSKIRNQSEIGFFRIKDEYEKFQTITNYSSSLTKEDFEKYFYINESIVPSYKLITDLTMKEKEIYIEKFSDFFEFDFMDIQNRKFNNLSLGEQTIFGQMLNIYCHSLENQKDLIFLLDEPDLSLHPEWQRRYLSELHNLLIKMEQKFHIILTSHSPFLLSDLPKENIIFLEKDKDGKCKNVSKETHIETFGANIHTLLSHGFFMKEGLIGEFAKNKINEVIDYLNGKYSPITDDDEAQRHVRIIGEPIVKRQLQRMLDSKKLDKMKEIDALKSQIESLQNRLENLEKKS